MNFLVHVLLAILLFLVINYIGEHSSTFGYIQMTLFVRRDEAPAFNFLLRALSPSVFIILVAVCLYTAHLDALTADLWKVAIYYYTFRLLFNIALGRAPLINWRMFGLQAVSGTITAYLAYQHLIIPRRPLFPNIETVGNELWIAIALFLYATFNNLRLSSVPSAQRKNRYLVRRFSRLRRDYSKLIEGQFPERYKELVAYAVLIEENFNRPPLIRQIERLLFPRWSRTLGIMQVRVDRRISDAESVEIGVAKMRRLFEETQHELASTGKVTRDWLINRAIAKYNRDERYVNEVIELLHILWAQVATDYRLDFEHLQDTT